MVFSSIEFLLYFLPIFFIIYALVPEGLKNPVLLVGSLIFYAYGEPQFLLLLIASVMVNYMAARFIGAENYFKEKYKNEEKYDTYLEWRKGVMLFIVTINVGILLLFKVVMGGETLPLGVSFYTFQVLSYMIDVYRRDIPAETSLLKLGTYIAMFPQLVSGPIVNYDEVSDALNKRKMTWKSVQNGLKVFTLGLASKVLIADRIGFLWNDIQMQGYESMSTALAWLGAIAFSFKIYFDFYGYSLMAIGLGSMMGFKLPENFRNPYMADSVRDFYRRWHITLSRWFCNYVYIPLGGSRNGEFCTIRNLLIVWALTGLWHGGNGNFLLWGIMLWAVIVVERQVIGFLDRHPINGESLWKQLNLIPRLYVWAIIPVTWMFFAITDIEQLKIYVGRMFGSTPEYVVAGDWRNALATYGSLLVVAALASTPILKRIYHRWRDHMVMNVVLAVLFWICVWRIMVEGNNPFMYFKF